MLCFAGFIGVDVEGFGLGVGGGAEFQKSSGFARWDTVFWEVACSPVFPVWGRLRLVFVRDWPAIAVCDGG